MEMAAVEATGAAQGGGFVETVALADAALAAGGRIVMTGIGKNIPVAEKISATLSSTGSPSVVLNPVQALHGDLGVLGANDLVVAMSYSGESSEVLNLVPHVRARGLALVAMTGCPGSTLARESDAVLRLAVAAECDPFDMAPTASTTATLALGDALAMVLLDLRGLTRDGYARLHPGGAIGQALLKRADDVMRTGERLAALPPEASVKDAIASMTRARAGAAFVVAPGGTLLGIFTDGDLRRFISRDGADLACPLSEAMTRNPVSIRGGSMATDVMRLFRERQIDDIPVVDGDGRLIGAIDISDLPKLKVM